MDDQESGFSNKCVTGKLHGCIEIYGLHRYFYPCLKDFNQIGCWIMVEKTGSHKILAPRIHFY